MTFEPLPIALPLSTSPNEAFIPVMWFYRIEVNFLQSERDKLDP